MYREPEPLLIMLAELLLGINGLFLLEEKNMKLQGPINKVLRCIEITEGIDAWAIGKGHTEHATGPTY